MYNGSIFQLYRYRLIVQFHQKPEPTQTPQMPPSSLPSIRAKTKKLKNTHRNQSPRKHEVYTKTSTQCRNQNRKSARARKPRAAHLTSFMVAGCVFTLPHGVEREKIGSRFKGCNAGKEACSWESATISQLGVGRQR